MEKWKVNLIVNFAFLMVVFDRTCKASVIVYFVSLLFADWQFYSVFMWTFFVVLTQLLLVLLMNKSKLNKELENVFSKEDNNSEV